MKNLFLTSEATQSLDKFVKIIPQKPQDLTVAFIPTAADVYDDKYFVDNDKNKLIALGFKLIEINIAEKKQNELQSIINQCDIIFVAGGNTFYLLEQIINSGFDTIIKNFVATGKFYIGSSAESVVAGKTIQHIKTIDNSQKAPNLKSFKGLNLIDKMILPHAKNPKFDKKIKTILQEYSNQKDEIILLSDNQALLVKEKKQSIIS